MVARYPKRSDLPSDSRSKSRPLSRPDLEDRDPLCLRCGCRKLGPDYCPTCEMEQRETDLDERYR